MMTLLIAIVILVVLVVVWYQVWKVGHLLEVQIVAARRETNDRLDEIERRLRETED